MGIVNPKKPSTTAVYTLRVDRALLARIHEVALAEHRTLSGKLRLMMEIEVARHDEQVAA